MNGSQFIYVQKYRYVVMYNGNHGNANYVVSRCRGLIYQLGSITEWNYDCE